MRFKWMMWLWMNWDSWSHSNCNYTNWGYGFNRVYLFHRWTPLLVGYSHFFRKLVEGNKCLVDDEGTVVGVELVKEK